MRKLVLKMSLSLDGFVGGPNGEVDWIFNSLDAAAIVWAVETLAQAGVHVMGSRTFHDMAAYWPSSRAAFAAPMNEIPKVMFSASGLAAAGADRTTTALKDAVRARPGEPAPQVPAMAAANEGWAHPRILSGELADDIAQLKREPGKPILAHGGARFARSLVALGLIDEYRLLIHPVALGSGLALFSALSAPLSLTLVSATSFPAGAVAHVYRPG